MDSVFSHDMEKSKTSVHFWPCKGHVKQCWCSLTVMSNGYRTLSQHLNDLKKENFSLKLRIYFLEERIQQKYEESSEDIYRTVSRTAFIEEMKSVWLAINGTMNGPVSGCSSEAKGHFTITAILSKTLILLDDVCSSFVPLSVSDCYHAHCPVELLYWATSTVCWPSCHTDLVVCFIKCLFLDMAAM